MKQFSVTEVKSNFTRIAREIKISHEPVYILSKENQSVLISLEDWEAIQETMFLLSIPNMRESIIDGLKTPIDECSKDLEW